MKNQDQESSINFFNDTWEHALDPELGSQTYFFSKITSFAHPIETIYCKHMAPLKIVNRNTMHNTSNNGLCIAYAVMIEQAYFTQCQCMFV